MKFGFAKQDITPPVGVDLCGFGPFILRHSVGVREQLWARAMAMEGDDGRRAVLITCDLIGISASLTAAVRDRLAQSESLCADQVMICCSHTHSGPSTGSYIGWGEPHAPYLALLPGLIEKACRKAFSHLQEATCAHAEVPCEGIGLNREYDVDAPPLADVLDENWRPAKPELTDTTSHVITIRNEKNLLGFISYFGCHPVVCCQETRMIHGDFCGVATNMLEREHPGCVGLFLQGAQGDVNSCVVHKPEPEALLALDVIASRYARAVRNGLRAAQPFEASCVHTTRRLQPLTRKPWDEAYLLKKLAECETYLHQDSTLATHNTCTWNTNIQVVYATGLRRLLHQLRTEGDIAPPLEMAGMRIGPIAILGSPFETFQAIKNDVKAAAMAPIPLVTGFVNDSRGYAPDRTVAARGGYAADMVPLIMGEAGLANIHEELVAAHLETDRILAAW